MRIAADLSSIASGGGVTHMVGWLTAAARLDTSSHYRLVAPRRVPPGIEGLPPSFTWHSRWLARLPAPLRLVAEQVYLPIWLLWTRADVLFSTADRTVLLAPCPTVLMIQNLNPYEGPVARTRAGRLRERVLAWLTAASARRAARVIFVSEHSRAIIAPRLRIQPERTHVVYHGVQPTLAVGVEGEASRAENDYVLSVGVVRGHKDLPTLVNAFEALLRARGRTGSPDLTLLVAAPVVDTDLFLKLQNRVLHLGLAERVRFLGPVERSRLAALYRGARLVVSTSLVETFGLALVEAMAAGAPVVSSDIPAAREVCQEAALYFPPSDAAALADRMTRVLDDQELAERLRQHGLERARFFSWDRTALQTLAVLEAAVRGGSPTQRQAQQEH